MKHYSLNRSLLLCLAPVFLFYGCTRELNSRFEKAFVTKFEFLGVPDQVQDAEINSALAGVFVEQHVVFESLGHRRFISVISSNRCTDCLSSVERIVHARWLAKMSQVSEFYELVHQNKRVFSYTAKEHKKLPHLVLRFEGDVEQSVAQQLAREIRILKPFHTQMLSATFPGYFQITLWPFTDSLRLFEYLEPIAEFQSEEGHISTWVVKREGSAEGHALSGKGQ